MPEMLRNAIRIVLGLNSRHEAAQIAVLNQLAHYGEMHAGELAKKTKLSFGRLFPALAELEERKLVASRWDDTMPYPRLRLYRIGHPGTE